MLLLDELAEFERPALDALREPLEEGLITISRARSRVRYPARFQLVAAMNPCRCGHFRDAEQQCRCQPGEAERYVARVSGPFLDRIDLRVAMNRVPPIELFRDPFFDPYCWANCTDNSFLLRSLPSSPGDSNWRTGGSRWWRGRGFASTHAGPPCGEKTGMATKPQNFQPREGD
ncbi:hypothetical protein BH23CHL7_BH23CHL7_05030 [soil metagenome]